MNLFEQLHFDWIESRKNKNHIKANLLGTLIGSFQLKEKNFNPTRKLSEQEMIVEIKKFADNLKETGRILSKYPNRVDDIKQNNNESTIISKYLPSIIDDNVIKEFAINKKKENKNIGQIMKELKETYPNQYDGKNAANIIKNILNS